MSDRLKGKRAVRHRCRRRHRPRLCAVAFAREGRDRDSPPISTKPRLAALKTAKASPRSQSSTSATRAAVAAMAKRVGKTDILLNAAGFVHHGTMLDCSDEDWDFSFDLNVKSMHRTIQRVPAGMLAGGGGTHRQHLVRRRRVQGRAQPLRLRRDQGRGCGADARRSPPTSSPRASAATASAPAPSKRPRCCSTRRRRRPGRARDVRRAAADGPARHRRGNRCAWPSISPATKARSPPASPMSSTAAGRCDMHEKGFRMNKIDLNDRCAVVTGGAQGFGRAIAERFVASGAKVAIWDHDLPFAEKTAKEIGTGVIGLQGRRVRSRRGREDARRDAEGARQDRHPRQQCRHRRRQQDGVGNRPRRMAQGAAHQSRRAPSSAARRSCRRCCSRNTAASSTSPRSPARKAIPTPRTIRPRRPA